MEVSGGGRRTRARAGPIVLIEQSPLLVSVFVCASSYPLTRQGSPEMMIACQEGCCRLFVVPNRCIDLNIGATHFLQFPVVIVVAVVVAGESFDWLA